MRDQERDENRKNSSAFEKEVDVSVKEAGDERIMNGSEEDSSEESALLRKVEEYKELYLRSQAEMENIMQRTKREIAHSRKLAGEALLTDLLPVVDSMIRGLAASKQASSAEAEALREGMQMTLDMVYQLFQKHGVEVLSPEVGAVFSPDWHEAVSSISDSGREKNTIAECVQVGFKLGNKVLRPAMVVVFV